ncbi:hypothetical protein ACFO4P_16885 [Epilithonimonas pallida]|uniref:HTH cro/C1-type domain-containing protein n=1 Tax=Epilithonimonas pallida TaxID=373671 RepID=A0ABY1R5F6_9FLAO|nr:hypothetical protein [Epilithonimonas pallida]SMP94657.1 hypothetical protein SAMN05421679_10662 [Epilithonimonas pallida]
MNIRDKILLFLKENDIEPKVFYESVGLSRQHWSNIVNGKGNFTLEIVRKIKTVYPMIDLNKLLDEKTEDYLSVAEDAAKYGEENGIALLKKDMEKAIKLLQRHLK